MSHQRQNGRKPHEKHYDLSGRVSGVGKYTIAREIVRQLPNFRLVDNHLINNPIFSLIQVDGKTKLPPRVWDNAVKIWGAVLDTIVHISPPDYSFVLTNALYESDESDRKWWKVIAETASKRNALFVPRKIIVRATRT